MVFYKIRDKITGLYSTGGSYVSWSKTGKTWDTLGKLRQHISMHLGKYGKPTDMSNWEVVECQTVVVAVKEVIDVIDPKKLIQILSKK